MNDRLTVGSLFSGIGGIDLGLERAGMVTRWFVEWDAHCQNVLRRHWPGLPVYGDITAVDWSGVEPVDVLAGGFPCQPVSVAGRGLAQEDVRWLWPAFLDAIRALRPRYVLVENVPGLLQRGLGIALADLFESGYDAEWDCIPAAAVGAPHRRDRLWIVAYPAGLQPFTGSQHAGTNGAGYPSAGDVSGRPEARAVLAHANGYGGGSQRHIFSTAGIRTSLGHDAVRRCLDDGIRLTANEGWWATEPDVGRVAHGVPHRVDRLRALGNAVVPQVVEWIGARIVAFDEGRVVA